MSQNIKMFVSNWYTDELGNRARIIKARDLSLVLEYGEAVPHARLRKCLWR